MQLIRPPHCARAFGLNAECCVRDIVRMTEDYQPTTRELYDLIVTLKEATELGFARVDQRFEPVEERLDRVEARLTGVEGRLTGVEGRLSGMERWALRIDERLSGVEGRLSGIEHWAVSIDQRLETIEGHNIAARFTDHDLRLKKLEQRHFETS